MQQDYCKTCRKMTNHECVKCIEYQQIESDSLIMQDIKELKKAATLAERKRCVGILVALYDYPPKRLEGHAQAVYLRTLRNAIEAIEKEP